MTGSTAAVPGQVPQPRLADGAARQLGWVFEREANFGHADGGRSIVYSVKLVEAAAGMAPTGTGSYSYWAYADVVVENLAFDKIVGVWGHQPLGDLWTLQPGTYQRSLPGNRELWHVQVGGTPIGRFAVQYQVLGCVFWDNNFGHDYFMDAQAAQQEDGTGTALIASPVQVTGSFNNAGTLRSHPTGAPNKPSRRPHASSGCGVAGAEPR